MGVTEIMATAQAETAVKRKAIRRVMAVHTRARVVALGSAASTEKRKYSRMASPVRSPPLSTADMGRDRSVRTWVLVPPAPRTRRATSPKAWRTALTMTGDMRAMDRRPAAKMPPMPMGRT